MAASLQIVEHAIMVGLDFIWSGCYCPSKRIYALLYLLAYPVDLCVSGPANGKEHYHHKRQKTKHRHYESE